MAINNIRVLKGGMTVEEFRVDDRTTTSLDATIKAGDAVKTVATTENFAAICLTGDPEQGTDIFIGVTKSESTETSTVDGVINVEIVGPGTVIEGRATTAANIDTDTKLLAFLNDYITFDRSAATSVGVLTIDEDEGSDSDVHALFVIGGDIVKGTLRVMPANATIWRGGV